MQNSHEERGQTIEPPLGYSSEVINDLVQLTLLWSSPGFQLDLARRAGLELPLPEQRAIWALAAAGPLRASSLAVRVGMTRSATSKVIGRLKDLSLITIEADAADARSGHVVLTREGRAAAAVSFRIGDLMGEALLAGWDREDVQAFSSYVARFLGAAQEYARQVHQP